MGVHLNFTSRIPVRCNGLFKYFVLASLPPHSLANTLRENPCSTQANASAMKQWLYELSTMLPPTRRPNTKKSPHNTSFRFHTRPSPCRLFFCYNETFLTGACPLRPDESHRTFAMGPSILHSVLSHRQPRSSALSIAPLSALILSPHVCITINPSPPSMGRRRVPPVMPLKQEGIYDGPGSLNILTDPS